MDNLSRFFQAQKCKKKATIIVYFCRPAAVKFNVYLTEPRVTCFANQDERYRHPER